MSLYAIFAADLLNTSPKPWVYGMTMCLMLGLSLGGPSIVLLLVLSASSSVVLSWVVPSSCHLRTYFEPYLLPT